MRETEYYRGYGYVSGDGVFDNILKGVTSVLASNRTKDVITEGAKAMAKSAGDKAGAKLVEKVSSTKAIKKENEKPRSKTKTNEAALREIYGDSIIGKGIRKIEV